MDSSISFQRRQSRPSDPDLFDEEACRDFLVDLGLSIVPNFSYEEGIPLVIEQVVAKYGRQNLADVLGLLYELLEDDSSPSGFNDDGDLWRPWRLAFKRRETDFSNPGTPREVGFILPAPTSKATRVQKAQRFLEVSADARNALRRLQNSPIAVATASSRLPTGTEGGPPTVTAPRAPEVPPSSRTRWRTPYRVVEEIKDNDEIYSNQTSLATLEGRGPPLIVANFANLFPTSEYATEEPTAESLSRLQRLVQEGPEYEGDEERLSVPLVLERSSSMMPRDPLAAVNPNRRINRTAFMLGALHRGPLPETRSRSDGAPAPSAEKPPRRRNEALGEHPINPLESSGQQQAEQDVPQRRPVLRVPTVQDIMARRAIEPTFTEVPVILHKLSPTMRQRLVDISPHFDEKVRALLGQPSSSREWVAEEGLTQEPSSMSESEWSGAAADDDESIYSNHDIIEKGFLDPQERTSPWYRQLYQHALAGPYENNSESEDLPHAHPKPATLRPALYVPGVSYSLAAIESTMRAGHVRAVTDLEQGEYIDWSPLGGTEATADQQDMASDDAGPVTSSSHPDELEPSVTDSANRIPSQPSSLNEAAHLPSLSEGGTEQQQVPVVNPAVDLVGGAVMEGDGESFRYDTNQASSLPRASTNEGTHDRHDDGTFTVRALDLNRELPALPVDERNQKFLTINTDRPSTLSSSSNIGSEKTPLSANRSSTVSSKRDFRHIAHGLMNPDSAGSSENLSAAYEPLEPTKFNPLEARKPLPKLEEHFPSLDTGDYSQLWSIARQTRWPGAEMASRPYQFNPSTCLPDKAHLPQSQSEHTFRRIEDTQRPSFDAPRRRSNSQDQNSGDRIPSPSSPTRGRFPRRSPSPTKYLDDLDEDEIFQYSSSPSKRSRSPKKLFGEGGWLGRSPSFKEKKSGFKQLSDKLKQGVEGLTESIKTLPATFHTEPSDSSEPTSSKFPVSLNPLLQARLYAEIEVMLCVTANKFLMAQYEAGRTSIESVKKVTEYWASRNRPQVIEFQWDQATQRDLIVANLKTFEFYGEAKENPMVLNSVLYNWRVMAKEISVRTFCTPDSVVRKHMHDAHKILEMLGAPLVTFLAFQELQISTLDTIKSQQEERFGRRSDNSGRSGGRIELLH